MYALSGNLEPLPCWIAASAASATFQDLAVGGEVVYIVLGQSRRGVRIRHPRCDDLKYGILGGR